MQSVQPGVTGFCHQVTGSLWIAFSSTIAPVLPSRVHAVRHQPQPLASLTTNVSGSEQESPLGTNEPLPAGTCLASWASMFPWNVLAAPGPLDDAGGAPAALCAAA